jgi:ankyrin repeat protein
MFLLAQGAIPDSRRTDGATPLWIAAQMGHDHVVKQLLKAGASVDATRHVSFMCDSKLSRQWESLGYDTV